MKIIGTRLFYNQGYAVCIAACEGGVEDWAAYMSAGPEDWDKDNLVQRTARSGGKLQREEAEAFFPSIKLTYRN